MTDKYAAWCFYKERGLLNSGNFCVHASNDASDRKTSYLAYSIDLSDYDSFFIGFTAASGDSYQEYAVK